MITITATTRTSSNGDAISGNIQLNLTANAFNQQGRYTSSAGPRQWRIQGGGNPAMAPPLGAMAGLAIVIL